MSKGETSYPKSHNLEVGVSRRVGLLVFSVEMESLGREEHCIFLYWTTGCIDQGVALVTVKITVHET